MTKTFLDERERELINGISLSVKSQIVDFIKKKYCLELINIDRLVENIIKNVIVRMGSDYNNKNGNILKSAEKWFSLSGIKTEFYKHSVYGFARSFDALNYTVIIPKKKVLTNFKYWLATKLFKIV